MIKYEQTNYLTSGHRISRIMPFGRTSGYLLCGGNAFMNHLNTLLGTTISTPPLWSLLLLFTGLLETDISLRVQIFTHEAPHHWTNHLWVWVTVQSCLRNIVSVLRTSHMIITILFFTSFFPFILRGGETGVNQMSLLIRLDANILHFIMFLKNNVYSDSSDLFDYRK